MGDLAVKQDRKKQELELQEYGPELLRELTLLVDNDFVEARIIQEESYVQWVRMRETLARSRTVYPN